MARQTGPLKYSGTIGDIRHFKIKGLKGDFAGLTGGPSAEQVKTAPEFKRTRENMNEFGGCAAAGKSVRVGLSQLMKQMSDPQLTGRLMSIMKKINLEDQSEARGYRAILISTQKQYLIGLGFNRNLSFEGIFNAPFTLISTAGRNSSTLEVKPFNPINFVNAPAGATHFRLISALSILSDFAYNSQSKLYEPIEASQNEVSKITFSSYLDLSTNIAVSTKLTTLLPSTIVISSNVSVLASIGIEFYQKVGNNYYLFNSGNALKIQAIF